MPRNNMPDNWAPAYPSWQSDWSDTTDPLIAGYFGVQADEPARLEAWAERSFAGEHAPFAVERGVHVGAGGARDYMFIAYWRRSDYRKWWALPGNSGWWGSEQRLEDGVGYWREIVAMPFERFETLHSSTMQHGVGVSAEGMDGPILEHGYPGGMRDRIPLTETDDIRRIGNIDSPLSATVSDDGRRVMVTPPKNMCVIRSGQNWSACEGDEKRFYLEKVHPTLLAGMRFLRDNPVESGCYSLRFVLEKDTGWGAMERSFGLGYALDAYAFEEWAKTHPTHLAILRSFMEMVNTFGMDIKLALWHEVTALPTQGCEFEYIACRSNTGLLGYT